MTYDDEKPRPESPIDPESESQAHDNSDAPQTHRSEIERAAQPGPNNRQAIGNVYTTYYRFVMSRLLRRWRLAPSDAEEIMQQLYEKIMVKGILAQYKPTKRFSSWLRVVVDNLARDFFKARRPHQPLPELPDERQDQEVDVEIARAVITETLRRVELELKRKGKVDVWDIFRERLLLPFFGGSKPIPYESLTLHIHGLADEKAAINALVTAKRKFRKKMREVIGEFAPNGGAVEDQIRDFIELLSHARLEMSLGEFIPHPYVNDSEVLDSVSDAAPSQLSALISSIESVIGEDHGEQWRYYLGSTIDRIVIEGVHNLPRIPHTPGHESTLSALLGQAQPDLKTLRTVKKIARDSLKHGHWLGSKAVGAVMYYASIASAYVHGGKIISKLSRAEIRDGLAEVSRYEWLDAPTRSLLEAAEQRFARSNA